MENTSFTYSYSAKTNNEVEKIRRKYMPYEESKLEKLKRLDSRVETAGVLESLCLGIIVALVFGVGMCFFLDVFAGSLWLTVLPMLLGTAMMLPAYPLYKRIAAKRKKELTPEILRLSDEITKS